MKTIDKLKKNVEDSYGFKIKKWKIIKHVKNSSVVIKVTTKENKKYALKSLYIAPERQHFIAISEKMLADKGVSLALPISTINGDLLMQFNRFPYVLYEWVKGKSSQLKHQKDLESIIDAMARFHHASHGLNYPIGITIYEHHNWKTEYKDRIHTMERWLVDHKSLKNKNEKIIHQYIHFFIRMATKALKALDNSNYDQYVKRPPNDKTLVHGDLHHSNVINDNPLKVLIDFEDIRYDLPSKDLLRIYSMFTKNHSFNNQSFTSMMNTYERVHPLSADDKELVYIDLLFPHIFERMLRKKKYIGMNAKELEHRIKQEKRKASYIDRHYFLKNRYKDGRENSA